jgi:hypothetical protein
VTAWMWIGAVLVGIALAAVVIVADLWLASRRWWKA